MFSSKLHKVLVLTALCASVAGHALRNSEYQKLLSSIDVYAPPKPGLRVMRQAELQQALFNRTIAMKIGRQDFLSAEENREIAYLPFRPKPVLASGLLETKTQGTLSNYARTFSLGLAVTGTTPIGLSYSIDLPRAVESETPLGIGGAASLGVNLSFSLLKGSAFLVGRNPMTKADLALEEAKLQLKTTTLQTLLAGEQAFYDVLIRQIRVQVLELSVESARALRVDIDAMVKAGESDALSRVQVDLQLAQMETDLLVSRNELLLARQALRNLLLLADNEPDVYPDPRDLKALPPAPSTTPAAAIETARLTRPDYLIAQIRNRNAEIDVDTAWSNVLPTFDLKAGYGYVASAPSMRTAIDGAFGRISPQSSIGFEFSVPLFYDVNRNGLANARIARSRAELALELVQQEMTREITNGVRSLEIGVLRVKSAQLARELAEKRLSSEFEKFKVGESRIRNIVDFQFDLNRVRIDEVSARVEFLRTLAVLRTAMGQFPPTFPKGTP